MSTIQIITVGVFAAAGAILRYLLTILYPFNYSVFNGILLANIIGCFFMGILLFVASELDILSQSVKLGLIVGFLGSFTTFSAFGGYFFEFIQNKFYAKAFMHVSITMTATLLSVLVGWLIASSLFSRFFN